jgi:hypothetical protein
MTTFITCRASAHDYRNATSASRLLYVSMLHAFIACIKLHRKQAGQAQQQGLAAAFRAWAERTAQRRAALWRLAAVHAHWATAAQRAAFAAWSCRAAWLARKRAAGLRILQVGADDAAVL